MFKFFYLIYFKKGLYAVRFSSSISNQHLKNNDIVYASDFNNTEAIISSNSKNKIPIDSQHLLPICDFEKDIFNRICQNLDIKQNDVHGNQSFNYFKFLLNNNFIF